MSADARRFAPATARNRDPIALVLERYMPQMGEVLEVASGSGEHVVAFAQRFPGVHFHPSDPDPDHRASIAAWIAHAGVPNVRAPISLDASAERWPLVAHAYAAVLCINMIHISPWSATQGLMRRSGEVLEPGGLLYLYGPYQRGGMHTAPSNAAFDADLRARNARWGVRDLDEVVAEAVAAGFSLTEVVEMPANNLSVVLHRRG